MLKGLFSGIISGGLVGSLALAVMSLYAKLPNGQESAVAALAAEVTSDEEGTAQEATGEERAPEPDASADNGVDEGAKEGTNARTSGKDTDARTSGDVSAGGTGDVPNQPEQSDTPEADSAKPDSPESDGAEADVAGTGATGGAEPQTPARLEQEASEPEASRQGGSQPSDPAGMDNMGDGDETPSADAALMQQPSAVQGKAPMIEVPGLKAPEIEGEAVQDERGEIMSPDAQPTELANLAEAPQQPSEGGRTSQDSHLKEMAADDVVSDDVAANEMAGDDLVASDMGIADVRQRLATDTPALGSDIAMEDLDVDEDINAMAAGSSQEVAVERPEMPKKPQPDQVETVADVAELADEASALPAADAETPKTIDTPEKTGSGLPKRAELPTVGGRGLASAAEAAAETASGTPISVPAPKFDNPVQGKQKEAPKPPAQKTTHGVVTNRLPTVSSRASAEPKDGTESKSGMKKIVTVPDGAGDAKGDTKSDEEADRKDDAGAQDVAQEREQEQTALARDGGLANGPRIRIGARLVQEKQGAMDRFAAQASPAAEGKSLLSVILIDEGSDGVDREMLLELGLPVTIAIDPALADAGGAMEKYRSNGFEVVTLANGLPAEATPSDVETALSAYNDILSESVAVMEPLDARLQGNSALLRSVLGKIKATGQGLITYDKGLNTAQKSAQKVKIPTATVFRVIDANFEEAAQVKRLLDRAAFNAERDGSVMVVGRSYPETIKALIEWSLENRESGVAIVPASQVMQSEKTVPKQ